MEQLRTSLSKAIEQTTDIAQGMAITYDDEIAMKTFQYWERLRYT